MLRKPLSISDSSHSLFALILGEDDFAIHKWMCAIHNQLCKLHYRNQQGNAHRPLPTISLEVVMDLKMKGNGDMEWSRNVTVMGNKDKGACKSYPTTMF